jgi:hypothetical protein
VRSIFAALGVSELIFTQFCAKDKKPIQAKIKKENNFFIRFN